MHYIFHLPVFLSSVFLTAFKIPFLLISSQGPATFHRLWHCPMYSPHSAVSPRTFSTSPSLDHFLPVFHLHLWHNLLPLHPAWILPFALQPCMQTFFFRLYSPLTNKLLTIFLCKSNTLHFVLPPYTYSDHLLILYLTTKTPKQGKGHHSLYIGSPTPVAQHLIIIIIIIMPFFTLFATSDNFQYNCV